MEKVKHECSELFCKPRARCFKGISILTLIFAICCILMAIIIGPIIRVHGDTTVNHNTNKNEPDAAEVKHRLKVMTYSTVWLSVAWLIISGTALALYFKYKKKEEHGRVNDDFRNSDMQIQTTNNYSSAGIE